MAKNNKSMQAAKVNKNDEFYTRLEDIEEEISMHGRTSSSSSVFTSNS